MNGPHVLGKHWNTLVSVTLRLQITGVLQDHISFYREKRGWGWTKWLQWSLNSWYNNCVHKSKYI